MMIEGKLAKPIEKDIELTDGCAVYMVERSYKDESTEIVINTDAVQQGVVLVIVPHGVEITRVL